MIRGKRRLAEEGLVGRGAAHQLLVGDQTRATPRAMIGLLPDDPRLGITVAIGAMEIAWIAYRVNPDSQPIAGSRSRLARFATLVVTALLGALIGAAWLVIVVTARRQVRLSEPAWPGALIGSCAALVIWERRAKARLDKQRREKG